MSAISDKAKIVYLGLLIVFCLGVFFYLLDSWQIINLENYLPGLSEEAPLAAEDQDAPSELEWRRLEKEQKRLEAQRLELEEELSQLRETKEALEERELKLEKKLEGFDKEKEAFTEAQATYKDRQKNIRDMAARLQAMPPQDAVEIISNWSNSDLLPVLLQMERNAQLEGNQSIVPYLLTLMPRERSALLMSLMIDEKAQKEEE